MPVRARVRVCARRAPGIDPTHATDSQQFGGLRVRATQSAEFVRLHRRRSLFGTARSNQTARHVRQAVYTYYTRLATRTEARMGMGMCECARVCLRVSTALLVARFVRICQPLLRLAVHSLENSRHSARTGDDARIHARMFADRTRTHITLRDKSHVDNYTRTFTYPMPM